MSIYQFTHQRCPDLAQFFMDCCASPLSFEGEHPNYHSYLNHIHLWGLEWWADHHAWIDLDYRVEFVEEIFSHWRGRLKGLQPYHDRGYRMYLYEDLAPTISVVAETDHGFAYDETAATFVETSNEIMALFIDRSWKENFSFEPWDMPQEKILQTVERNKGSISKPTANALGVKVGQLRTLIEQMMLNEEVNAIRKRYKRRPATFKPEEDFPFRFHILERKLPSNYR